MGDMLRRLTRFETLNVPEHDRSDVFPGFLPRARSSSATSSPAPISLPDPQLDEHRTMVGELIPHRLIRLSGGDVTEGRAIDPGQDPPVDNDVIDKLGERIVPAADGHVLRDRREVGVGGLAARCASLCYASLV
jgi:hypothetical protein